MQKPRRPNEGKSQEFLTNVKAKNSKQSANFTINGHGNSTKNISYNKKHLNVGGAGPLGGLGLGGNAIDLN